jgi:hypothetical protein
VGRNVNAPNIANPTMKARITLMLNTAERNSLMGRIGSVARVSTTTNTASATIEPANSPRIVVDVQGYCVPPHDNARVSPEAPRETNTMPR